PHRHALDNALAADLDPAGGEHSGVHRDDARRPTVDDLDAKPAGGQGEQRGARYRQNVLALFADEVDIHGSGVHRTESLLLGDRHSHLDARVGGCRTGVTWSGVAPRVAWSGACFGLCRGHGSNLGDLPFHGTRAGNRDGDRAPFDCKSPVGYPEVDSNQPGGAGVAEHRGGAFARTATDGVADAGRVAGDPYGPWRKQHLTRFDGPGLGEAEVALPGAHDLRRGRGVGVIDGESAVAQLGEVLLHLLDIGTLDADTQRAIQRQRSI